MTPWPLVIRYYHPVLAVFACSSIELHLGASQPIANLVPRGSCPVKKFLSIHVFDSMRAGGRERRIPPDLAWQLLGANPQYVGWTIPNGIVQSNVNY
ncbi:unnamed protein product (mitochondrion) [Plasmodiophora brassicae]|uniref:Uncharacterized protein n=1 Tax=Plasmodiophora brassicae TaxID=37360 RepID=A0A3P3YKP8_PLABS|nr:unnamed protein product [Plasmodiophora brassicae]